MFKQPEFARNGSAGQIVEILEEQTLLKNLLSEAPDQGGPAVFVGLENQYESLRQFGVILSRYGVPGETSGTIGVIGPRRMEYANAIATVGFLSSVMSEMIIHSQDRA